MSPATPSSSKEAKHSSQSHPGVGSVGSGKHKSKAYNSTLAIKSDAAKYRSKYKDLKKKVLEVEEENDRMHAKTLGLKRNIQRMRLERALLYEKMESEMLAMERLGMSSEQARPQWDKDRYHKPEDVPMDDAQHPRRSRSPDELAPRNPEHHDRRKPRAESPPSEQEGRYDHSSARESPGSQGPPQPARRRSVRDYSSSEDEEA